MMNYIEKLKDPLIVVKFQNYFGVEVLKENDENKNQIANQKNDLNIKNKRYIIKNYFFYYLFFFGSSLGYEAFYAIFFPFWFWNIDGWVGRRVMIVWSITMYIGQTSKDIIKWERPKSPLLAVLEPTYAMEYGMPSTHALAALTLPFSIFILSNSRYEYSNWIGLILSSLWCILVCASRLYLGMHSLLDIIGGVLLGIILLIFCIPLINIMDEFYLKNKYAPIFVLPILLILIIYYPKSDRWSPSRGDTCLMASFTYGILTGTWLNYQLKIISEFNQHPPFPIILPTNKIIFYCLLRTLIGLVAVFQIKNKGKILIYYIICYIQRLNPNDSKTKNENTVKLSVKFITYTLTGMIVTYLCPLIFRLMNIERIKMHTEV